MLTIYDKFIEIWSTLLCIITDTWSHAAVHWSMRNCIFEMKAYRLSLKNIIGLCERIKWTLRQSYCIGVWNYKVCIFKNIIVLWSDLIVRWETWETCLWKNILLISLQNCKICVFNTWSYWVLKKKCIFDLRKNVIIHWRLRFAFLKTQLLIE